MRSQVVLARLVLSVLLVLSTASCIGTSTGSVARATPAPIPEPSEQEAQHDAAGRAPSQPSRPGTYNLGQLPVLSKVLFYLRENYFDKSRFHYREMALGALQFVQRDTPEVVIDHLSGPASLGVTVAGQRAVFSLQTVDAAWSLRSRLQEIFRFVQNSLPPAPPQAEGPRLLQIEVAAANGMLYTLDPRSVLLDPREYAQMFSRPVDDRSAGVGLMLKLDRDGGILVVAVEPGAPADRAGISAGSRLARIDDDATQNMTLEEVIDRLRGAPGSKVALAFERPPRRTVERRTLERAMIPYRSVAPAPRLLGAKIGYLRLRRLGSGASLEVHDALTSFNREGANGVILDLRGNGGGLYAEAVKVADEFVAQGTIVSMVGPGGSPRKDETATGTAATPQLPLVVLVDHGTASGAEVVAAAIKNLDRGALIGEPTFGMGTVQVLFDVPSPLAQDPGDRSKLGLKLTTAQMLAAGGEAIQDSGVLPDISTEGLSVPTNDPSLPVHLQGSRHFRSERQYERALPPALGAAPRVPTKPVRYLRADSDELAAPDPDTDPLVALAKELLQQNHGFERHQLLAASEGVVARWSEEQDLRLGAALARRHVDWSSGPAGPPPPMELTLERADGRPGGAGRAIALRATVKNVGAVPAFRVRAVVVSDDPTFDETELVFGKIAPGQSKTYDLPIPSEAPERPRTAVLKATLIAQDHALARGAELRMAVEGAPPSTLAFRYRVGEGTTGSNHDGKIERDEPIEIPVIVTNGGPANIARLRATLVTEQPGAPVRIPKGRFELRGLAAGASERLTFVAIVGASFASDNCSFKIALEPDAAAAIEQTVRVDLSPPSGPTEAKADIGFVEVDPPRMAFRAPAVATGETVRIEGTAASDRGIRDVYIRVWNRNLKVAVEKVLYRLNQPSGRPQMSLAVDIPVTRGMNAIQVFARDTSDLRAEQTLMVLKER